ncbi:MAG: hypothetical protein IKB01_12255, partial [Lachnospiraceae bacterium]|nr:hypothetical protein [Lachnospiraceae bacterium]
KKQDYLTYLLQIGVVFGAYLYLYISGRFLYNRVDVVAWLGAIIAVLYMWEPSYDYKFQSEKVKKCFLATAQVCVVVYLCFTCSEMFRWNYDSRTEDNTLAREIDIKADKEHLYLCTINLFGTSVTWDPFYVAEEGELSNFYLLGSWTVNTPITNQVLQNYGVKNPYRDIIDNPNVYILEADNNAALLQYIQENYSEKAQLEVARLVGGYKAYRVVTKD